MSAKRCAFRMLSRDWRVHSWTIALNLATPEFVAQFRLTLDEQRKAELLTRYAQAIADAPDEAAVVTRFTHWRARL